MLRGFNKIAYTLSQVLSVTALQLLDFVKDLFLELDVAVVDMLRKFLHCHLHGFRRLQNGAV